MADGEALERAIDTLGRAQQRLLLLGGVLDHRDDIDQRLVVARRVGAPQILFREMLRRGGELFSQFRQCVGASVFGTVQQDADGLDALRIGAHELRELGKIIVGTVLVAGGVADENAR